MVDESSNPPLRPHPLADDKALRYADRVSKLFDNQAIDPLLGLLFPGAGDVASSALGLYTVWLGIRRGVSIATITRMLFHLAVDALVGVVPVFGDVFDLFYKAHRKNMNLLLEETRTRKAKLGDWLILLAAVGFFVAALCAPIAALVWTVTSLFGG